MDKGGEAMAKAGGRGGQEGQPSSWNETSQSASRLPQNQAVGVGGADVGTGLCVWAGKDLKKSGQSSVGRSRALSVLGLRCVHEDCVVL